MFPPFGAEQIINMSHKKVVFITTQHIHKLTMHYNYRKYSPINPHNDKIFAIIKTSNILN